MTLHVPYDHQCSQCGAFYIPFAPGVACPRCGHKGGKLFAFIPRAAASLRFNLDSYGSYLPGAWYVGSLGDHILRLLFNLFEDFRRLGSSGAGFEDYLGRKLSAMDWGEQPYLKDHLRAIALRVHAELGSKA